MTKFKIPCFFILSLVVRKIFLRCEIVHSYDVYFTIITIYSEGRIQITKSKFGLLVVQHAILQMMLSGDLLQKTTKWSEWEECFNQDTECHFYSQVDS